MIYLDMNLSPSWVPLLYEHGFSGRHWLEIGQASSRDDGIMARARADGAWIIPHDLDFGTLLAHTHEHGPSVIQIRGTSLFPSSIGEDILEVLHKSAMRN